jgi:hypothetical protein
MEVHGVVELLWPPCFIDWFTDGGEVFSLACWQPFTPLKVPGIHFKETKLWQ